VDGFYNKIIQIDVSQGSFEEEFIDDEIYREFLGGKGLGTHLLLNSARAGVEPLFWAKCAWWPSVATGSIFGAYLGSPVLYNV